MGVSRIFDGNAANSLLGEDLTGQSAYTVACWVKADVLVGTQQIISHDESGRIFQLRLDGAALAFFGFVGSSTIGSGGGLSNLSVGVYSHVAGTVQGDVDPSRGFKYVDGVQSTGSSTAGLQNTDLSNLTIGNRQAAGAFDGSIAWPCIWKVVLTPAEIAQLAAGAYPTSIRPDQILHFWPFTGGVEEDAVSSLFPLTTLGTVGTANDADALVDTPPVLSRVFKGDNADRLQTVATTHPQTYSLAGWIKLNSFTVIRMIIASQIGQTNFQFRVEINGNLTLIAFDSAGASFSGFKTGLTLGKFQHVAGTLKGSSPMSGTVYLDGVPGAPFTKSGVGAANTELITIGRRSTTEPFDGNIAWLGLWTVELTAAEVAQLAAGADPLTVRGGNLKHFWPFRGNNPELGEGNVPQNLSMEGSVGLLDDSENLVNTGTVALTGTVEPTVQNSEVIAGEETVILTVTGDTFNLEPS